MPRKTNTERNRAIARALYVDNTPAAEVATQFNLSRQQVYRTAERQLQADTFSIVPGVDQERIPIGPLFSEQGRSGLKRFGGFIDDDYSRVFRNLYRRIQLYREMGDDPICAAVMQAIKMRMRSVGWYVETDGTSDGDKQARDFVEQCMDDMSQTWADSIDQALDMIQYGFQLSELVYKKRNGPKDESGSKYDDGRIGWRKWTFIAPESLYQGQEWVFDKEGGLQGYTQNAPPDYQAVTISIEKSILFRTTLNKNNPEGRSLFRAMYSPWYYKKNLEEIEAISAERMGAGLPVIYAGKDVSKGTSKTQDMGALYDIVRNVRADEQMGVVIPFAKMGAGAVEGEGVLMELLSPPSRGVVNFHETVARHEQRMAMVGLSQFIMLGMNQVGARALGEPLMDFFTLSLVGWLDNLQQTIQRYGTDRLMRLNNFPGLTTNPRIVPESLTGQNLAELSDYIDKLVGRQVLTPTEDLERHLLEMADLPQSKAITELWAKKYKAQEDARQAMLAPKPIGPFQKPVDETPASDDGPNPEAVNQDSGRELTGETTRAELFAAQHNGVMICFYLDPELSRTLVVADGEAPEDLHITLAMLGDARLISEDKQRRLVNTVRGFAMFAPPVTGKITGPGEFSGEGAARPVILLADLPKIVEWRAALMESLELSGFVADGTHGFIPHITLKYSEGKDKTRPAITSAPLLFDTLTLKLGDARYDFRLSGEYADGYGVVSDKNSLAQSAETLAAEIRATRQALLNSEDLTADTHNENFIARTWGRLTESLSAMAQRPVVVHNSPTIRATLSTPADSFQVNIAQPAPPVVNVSSAPATVNVLPSGAVVNVAAPEVRITNDVQPAPVTVVEQGPKSSTEETIIARAKDGSMTGSTTRVTHKYGKG